MERKEGAVTQKRAPTNANEESFGGSGKSLRGNRVRRSEKQRGDDSRKSTHTHTTQTHKKKKRKMKTKTNKTSGPLRKRPRANTGGMNRRDVEWRWRGACHRHSAT